jgi:hypothetical protein
MLTVYIHHAFTLLFMITMVVIAVGTCNIFLNRIGIVFTGIAERVFYALGLGLATMAYMVFILCTLQSVYPFVIYALMIIFFLIGLPGCLHLIRQIKPFRTWLPHGILESGAFLLLAMTLGLLLLLVLTPEIGKDALIYHLAVPKLFIEHHGFYFVEGNAFANYPLFGEMLYIIGLVLQDDTLAKSIHFIPLLAILSGTGIFIHQRFGKGAFPYLTLLILLSVPSVFITAHMAYNDFFVTYFCLGAVLAFIAWTEQNGNGWLVLCGLYSGLAVACKYTALLLPFLGGLGLLWNVRSRNLSTRETIHILILYAIFLILAGSPFYIKNWIVTGNPVYPFLYSIFGGVGWDPDQARLYDIFVRTLGMGKEAIDYLLLPWNVSLRAKLDSPQFDGILGPVFLLTLPFACGIRKWGRLMPIILVYAFGMLIFWAASAQQIRYLFPVLPALCITIAYILSYYHDRKLVLAVLYVLIAASLIYNFYYIARDFQKIRPFGVVSGMESRTDFLKRSIPVYPMYDYINRELPPDAKVYLIYMKNYGFLCNRAFYADAMFESYTLQKILSASRNAREVNEALKKKGITHILYDAHYVTGGSSTLSPQEKRLFAAFQKEYLHYVTGDKSYLLFRLE